MKIVKLLLPTSLLLLSTSALAMQCQSLYQGYKWDRAVMGTPKQGVENNVACLYNKNADPMMPPSASYSVNGTFTPKNPGDWSGTSEPMSITCASGRAACAFK